MSEVVREVYDERNGEVVFRGPFIECINFLDAFEEGAEEFDHYFLDLKKGMRIGGVKRR